MGWKPGMVQLGARYYLPGCYRHRSRRGLEAAALGWPGSAGLLARLFPGEWCGAFLRLALRFACRLDIIFLFRYRCRRTTWHIGVDLWCELRKAIYIHI